MTTIYEELDPDHVESRTRSHLSCKNLKEHIVCLLNYWRKFLVYLSVAFLGLIGIVSATGSLLSLHLSGLDIYTGIFSISFLMAFWRVYYLYINDSPAGFENESQEACRIAQMQRSKWEFLLANQLLQDKLKHLNTKLEDLLAGRTHVPIENRLGLSDYIEWAQIRTENILKMLDVAKHLIVRDFPAALLTDNDRMPRSASILSNVGQIVDLYADTVAFEKDNRSIAPPESLTQLHNLQIGWTTPIRDGVNQLFDFLTNALAINLDEDSSIEFEIVFGEPPNIAEFLNEMERLDASLPWIALEDYFS